MSITFQHKGAPKSAQALRTREVSAARMRGDWMRSIVRHPICALTTRVDRAPEAQAVYLRRTRMQEHFWTEVSFEQAQQEA
jgi:hypothetical protein